MLFDKWLHRYIQFQSRQISIRKIFIFLFEPDRGRSRNMDITVEFPFRQRSSSQPASQTNQYQRSSSQMNPHRHQPSSRSRAGSIALAASAFRAWSFARSRYLFWSRFSSYITNFLNLPCLIIRDNLRHRTTGEVGDASNTSTMMLLRSELEALVDFRHG